MPAHTQKHVHKIVFIHYAVSHLQECSHSVFQVSLSSVVNKHIGRIPQIVLKVWSNLAAALLLYMSCGFLLTYFYCFHLMLTSVMNVKWFLLADDGLHRVSNRAKSRELHSSWIEFQSQGFTYQFPLTPFVGGFPGLFPCPQFFSLLCNCWKQNLCGVKHFPR